MGRLVLFICTMDTNYANCRIKTIEFLILLDDFEDCGCGNRGGGRGEETVLTQNQAWQGNNWFFYRIPEPPVGHVGLI